MHRDKKETRAKITDAIAAQTAAVRDRVRARLGSGDEVEDLVQETMARALQSAADIKNPGAVRPWLLTIAERTVFDHLRRRGRRTVRFEVLPEDPAGASPSPAQSAEDLEFWEFVTSQLDAMPTDLREVGHRYAVLGESLGEIGKALGRAKSSVQRQLDRVRERLEPRLTEAGYAALMPLLDISQPIRPAVGAAVAATATRSHSVLSLVGLLVLVGGLAWFGAWQLLDSGTGSTGSADREARAGDGRELVGGERPRSKDARASRTAVDGAQLVHGRVRDKDGKPVGGATVRVYDYLKGEYRTKTAADGTFRIEETRDTNRPFEVLVEAPADSGLERHHLDAVRPAETPREIRLLPTVTVRLIIEPDDDYPVDTFEVTVVDLRKPDPRENRRFWPSDVGTQTRQLLPADYSILMQRTVRGKFERGFDFEGLPRTELGFFLRAGDLIWFAATSGARAPADVTAALPARVALRISVYAAPGDRNDRAKSPLMDYAVRGYRDDLVGFLSQPERLRLWEEASRAGLEGWNYDPPPPYRLDGVACFYSAGGGDPVGPGVEVHVDLPALSSLPTVEDRLPVLIQAVANHRTLVGFAASRRSEKARFPRVPAGVPLELLILDPTFERVVFNLGFQIPGDTRGQVDLLAQRRRIAVLATQAGAPVSGLDVDVFGSSGKARHSVPLQATTGRDGRATISLTMFSHYDLRVDKSFEDAWVKVFERGAVGLGPSFEHQFEFGASVRLRIRDGAGWLSRKDGQELHIEGRVVGARTVAFRQEVDACADGMVTVLPGLAGVIEGRVLYYAEKGEDWKGLPRWASFRATTAGPGERPPTIDVALPAHREKVQLRIRLVGADGKRFDTRPGLFLGFRPRQWTGMHGLAEPGGFDGIEWNGKDAIDAPAALIGAEVRLLVPGFEPCRAHVPEPGSDGAATLTFALRPARTVSLWDRPGRAGLDGFRGEPLVGGLRSGDLVSRVGERVVRSPAAWQKAIAAADQKAPLALELRRDGEVLRVTLQAPWARSLKDLYPLSQ